MSLIEFKTILQEKVSEFELKKGSKTSEYRNVSFSILRVLSDNESSENLDYLAIKVLNFKNSPKLIILILKKILKSKQNFESSVAESIDEMDEDENNKKFIESEERVKQSISRSSLFLHDHLHHIYDENELNAVEMRICEFIVKTMSDLIPVIIRDELKK